jgi:hypothetical protein
VSRPREEEHLAGRLNWERRPATEPHLSAASHLVVLRRSQELAHSPALRHSPVLPDLPEARLVREPGLLAEPRSATAAAQEAGDRCRSAPASLPAA